MYNLPYFKEEDKAVVLQFVNDYPFAFLSGCDANNKPVATQVPFFVDERDGKIFLSGHIMKNTDHHKAFLQNNNVLAVFTGPHTYVSATWYDNPHQASTWNYMSVYAKGIISFGGQDELVAILKRLTLHYESNNSTSTTVFDNLPPAYLQPLIKAIVSFEIEVVSIENVFKLSQNRDEKSYDNIIDKLKQQGGNAEKIGTIMEERKTKVYPS
ncbi:MAG: FMN-binding negative transcriptional regulator [Bacteroidota bacterium]|nr:FMN-binding negative transcriptional regulator [Bacteroidota bacterium]